MKIFKMRNLFLASVLATASLNAFATDIIKKVEVKGGKSFYCNANDKSTSIATSLGAGTVTITTHSIKFIGFKEGTYVTQEGAVRITGDDLLKYNFKSVGKDDGYVEITFSTSAPGINDDSLICREGTDPNKLVFKDGSPAG
jgi:hypothetical protein